MSAAGINEAGKAAKKKIEKRKMKVEEDYNFPVGNIPSKGKDRAGVEPAVKKSMKDANKTKPKSKFSGM